MSFVSSWGRFPCEPQVAKRVAWRDSASEIWRNLGREHGSTLAFGNGRSYGDSCLAATGHVIQTLDMDRLIEFDEASGVLRAEAGITFEQILAVTIPKGWMLPVTPGTKYVTLAGAIANDVHGKNHHVRGTFGRHLRRFALARSDGMLLECSLDEHSDYFRATIGGLGLTGLIIWAEIQLVRIKSSVIDVKTIKFPNLAGFFELSDVLDAQHEYSVAWVDCQSRGSALGRGVFMVGDHAESGQLEVSRRKKHRVPFTFPLPVFNAATLRLLNNFYYNRPVQDQIQQDYDTYFYPLDRILEWNRIYGTRGFQQYQCVVPPDVAREAIHAILASIASQGTGSFLAVLKRCGDIRSPGLLSFPRQGTSLALDFPQRTELNISLFRRLDAIVREANGRLYPAKDAHMSAIDFRASYPEWSLVESLRDPAMMSRFWLRTTKI